MTNPEFTPLPEDQLEQTIVSRPPMNIALHRESVRSRLSSIRSSIAHVERLMVRETITEEMLKETIVFLGEAEDAMFRARYVAGYQ